VDCRFIIPARASLLIFLLHQKLSVLCAHTFHENCFSNKFSSHTCFAFYQPFEQQILFLDGFELGTQTGSMDMDRSFFWFTVCLFRHNARIVSITGIGNTIGAAKILSLISRPESVWSISYRWPVINQMNEFRSPSGNGGLRAEGWDWGIKSGLDEKMASEMATKI